MKKLQRFLVPMFTFIWWNRLEYTLWNGINFGVIYRGQIVKVKGWRTALVDEPGRVRKTITFCFGRYL